VCSEFTVIRSGRLSQHLLSSCYKTRDRRNSNSTGPPHKVIITQDLRHCTNLHDHTKSI